MGTKALLDESEALRVSEEPTDKEVEPRVKTEDVSVILRRIVRPDDPDAGAAVSLIAERADTSTRTVYRVLSVTTDTLSLDLADRLCLAANAHLASCRLVWPDGCVTPYF
jgi:hypothetical protein